MLSVVIYNCFVVAFLHDVIDQKIPVPHSQANELRDSGDVVCHFESISLVLEVPQFYFRTKTKLKSD